MKLWVVERSAAGKDWRPSIHDWNWWRVALTKAEAEEWATKARAYIGASLRYRVRAYQRVERVATRARKRLEGK